MPTPRLIPLTPLLSLALLLPTAHAQPLPTDHADALTLVVGEGYDANTRLAVTIRRRVDPITTVPQVYTPVRVTGTWSGGSDAGRIELQWRSHAMTQRPGPGTVAGREARAAAQAGTREGSLVERTDWWRGQPRTVRWVIDYQRDDDGQITTQCEAYAGDHAVTPDHPTMTVETIQGRRELRASVILPMTPLDPNTNTDTGGDGYGTTAGYGTGSHRCDTTWTLDLRVIASDQPGEAALLLLREDRQRDAEALADLQRQLHELTQAFRASQIQQHPATAPPAAAPSPDGRQLTLTNPNTLHTYTFVYVPGDPTTNIPALWVATTETTWNQFRTYAFCEDLDDPNALADLRDRELRPTPGYGDMSQGMGFGDRPALGVSWRNAEAYAVWLADQLDRPVRLPTDAEWRHITRLAYGDTLPAPSDLRLEAHLDQSADEFFWETRPAATLQPNRLGLYDWFGNVAEWTTGPDDQRRVRGASFDTPLDDVTPDWQAVEDPDVWLAGFPDVPRTKWWYTDRLDVGLRLVLPADD